jgi:hypothetical protein
MLSWPLAVTPECGFFSTANADGNGELPMHDSVRQRKRRENTEKGERWASESKNFRCPSLMRMMSAGGMGLTPCPCWRRLGISSEAVSIGHPLGWHLQPSAPKQPLAGRADRGQCTSCRGSTFQSDHVMRMMGMGCAGNANSFSSIREERHRDHCRASSNVWWPVYPSF